MKRREIMKINEEELCEIVKEYLIEEGKRLQEVLSFVMKDKIIKKKYRKKNEKKEWNTISLYTMSLYMFVFKSILLFV